ncbi:MAG: AbrB/MazE/SpoVT family DNA-binding domain-containing protein [Acidobacteriota bacterium]
MTIPEDIVGMLKWKEGQNVTFQVKDGKLVVETEQ